MISLPKAPNQYSKPVWNQPNNSDTDGSLYASFNCDVTYNEGKFRLGQRMLLATGQVDDSDMTSYPIAFIPGFIQNGTIYGSSSTNYTIMGSYIWNGYDIFTQTALKDTHTSPPAVSSTLSDMIVFNSELYASDTAGNMSYITSSSSAWQGVNLALGSVAVSLCVFQNILYGGGGSQVHSMTAAHTASSSGPYTITALPDPGLSITFVRAASNRIWIGTVNFNGGKAYVYEWDGVATQVTKGYRLESSGALACVIKDDIPYIIDSNGKLLAWNGGTFVELSRLNRINNKTLLNSNSTTNNRFIHPNGIALIQGRICMLINGANNDGLGNEETIPSGIYEYTPEHGLIHKYSIAQTKVADTIVDYGQINLSGVGALTAFNYTISGGPSTNTDSFFAGATYYMDASTTKAGIFYNNGADNLQKSGYLITPKLSSIDVNGLPSVQNMWQNFYTLYKSFLDTNDKIYIKYRKQGISEVTITATWTSTMTFTTPTDLSALVGYEIEVVRGIGGGKTAHIVSAPFSAGSCTVTLDDPFTGASGTAKVKVKNWKKISDMDTTSQATFDQANVGILSNWIQFKVTMQFTGKDELERLIIINKDFNPAN